MLLASIFLLNTLTMLTNTYADRSTKDDERFRTGSLCDLNTGLQSAPLTQLFSVAKLYKALVRPIYRMKNGLNKCHKWQHWMGEVENGVVKFTLVSPTTFVHDCWIKYTLGWHFRNWLRSGFVLNFHGFFLQGRCIFPKRRSFFLYGEVILLTEDVCISKEHVRIFSEKRHFLRTSYVLLRNVGGPVHSCFHRLTNPFCIVKVKSMWAVWNVNMKW